MHSEIQPLGFFLLQDCISLLSDETGKPDLSFIEQSFFFDGAWPE